MSVLLNLKREVVIEAYINNLQAQMLNGRDGETMAI